MATGSLVSIQEYLTSAFSPDCDYVDGVIEERNLGERDHARLQGAIFAYLYARRKEWGIHVYPEMRVQVSATRFRVPDVCVVAGPEPAEQIFRTPPFICIEVLSPDDRLTRMQERVDDYIAFGVPYIWILNPENCKAYRCTAEGMLEVKELRTESPAIVVPLEALFE
ncbi:MAG: Uma2 family endonuclease [Bryobacteraceae bacterium]|jgi:Uma2 family endonuclease